MSTVSLLPRAREARRPSPEQPSLFEVGGDQTLDERVSCAWEDLLASGTTGCPVCGELMDARHGAGALAIAGRCRGCGSGLE